MSRVLTAPNVISLARVAAVPILFYLGWTGRQEAFLTVFVCALASDLADGAVARKLGEVSERGARLDTWGDVLTYFALSVCAWRLWPAVMYAEFPFVITLIISYLLPIAFGLVKFRQLTSYHTWSTKTAAVAMGVSIVVLFAGWSRWPFRLLTPLFVLASLEQVAIGFVLPKPRTNVPTLWHALKMKRNNGAGGGGQI